MLKSPPYTKASPKYSSNPPTHPKALFFHHHDSVHKHLLKN
jgi:hypothetical protein